MNIFVTSCLPEISAQEMCDQHIRSKMLLESVQMLSTSLRSLLPMYTSIFDDIGIYKAVHVSHPCNKWLRESPWNFEWLVLHTQAIESIRLEAGLKWHKSMDTLKRITEFRKSNKGAFIGSFPLLHRNKHTVPLLAMPETLQLKYGYLDAKRRKKVNKDTYRGRDWGYVERAYQEFIPSKVFKDGQVPTWTINPEPSWRTAQYDV